jgi:hypothetical protein
MKASDMNRSVPLYSLVQSKKKLDKRLVNSANYETNHEVMKNA